MQEEELENVLTGANLLLSKNSKEVFKIASN